MSNNDKVTSQALHKSREGTPEEVRLQTTAENWQRWCGRVGYAIRSICLSSCLSAFSRKKLHMDLHEFFVTKGRSWPSLKVISFCR